MTGYGKGECTLSDHSKITVEIKSLNGKNADINFKSQIIPKDKELEIRKLLAEKLVRGSIEFSINQEMKSGTVRRQINETLAKSLLAQAKKVAGAKADENTLLAAVLRMPEVLEIKEKPLSASDMAKIDRAVEAAVKKINSYRETEGKALYKDVTKRVANILKCLEQVKKEDGRRVPAIKERLRQKVEKSGIAVDGNRLEQEIVFYVEKLDINEEKVRLAQHCKYFMETIDSDSLAGKKIGFIVQEMGREINTLGSKANDAVIQSLVVKMKDELEKIREQSLNIL
ncbi:MAG: YicC family protein [Bacteroidales bacterium]|nr:YicC family protein [Bacteroidales bacterium]